MAQSRSTSTSKAFLGHLCRAMAVWLCSLSVAQAASDLTITDIREKDGVISYDMKNQGTSLAPPGHVTSLSVDGSPKDTDSISVAIQPGKAYTGSFAKYKWQCLLDGKHTVQVKADSTNKIQESTESNNTLEETWTCDLTAPKITAGPMAIDITETSAKITWTTNEASDSTVRYGTQPGTLDHQVHSSAAVTSHQILLQGLNPGTAHYFKVESADASGNSVAGNVAGFTTQSRTLPMPDLIVSRLWREDHKIHYEVQNQGDGDAPAGHKISLSLDGKVYDTDRITVALNPGSSVQGQFPKFYFRCMADRHVLEGAADAESAVAESIEINNTRPLIVLCGETLRIVSGPKVASVTGTTASITWTTNLAADSRLRYDTRASLLALSRQDSAQVQEHKLNLSGLTPGQLYEYQVTSRSEETDQSASSRPAFFRTTAKPGNKAPQILSLTMDPEDSKAPLYTMKAKAADDQGIAKVEFFVDHTLIHTDYSEPYECPVLPASLGMSRAEFFNDHKIEAVATDFGMLADSAADRFRPAYTCPEVTAHFTAPYPGDTIYLPADTAPAGTTVPITVYAAMWDLVCVVPGVRNPTGEWELICDTELSQVQEVRFYANSVYIGTAWPRDSASFIQSLDWDLSGYRAGDYQIRADVVGDANCLQTLTLDTRIAVGSPRLEVTREVTRTDNWFHVALRLRNRGTVSFSCQSVLDNVDGMQPIAKTEPDQQVQVILDAQGRHCDLIIRCTGTGGSSTEIRPDHTLTVEYDAVPVQLPSPGATNHAIGHDAIYVIGTPGLDDSDFSRPCILTTAGLLLDGEVDAAIAGSDYLIVSNPETLRTEFGAPEDVATAMAILAKARNGILGYASGTSAQDPAWVRDSIQDWGATMSGSAGGSYLSSGYLLLVGETEVVPSWTVDIPDVTWDDPVNTIEDVNYSDLPYADLSGSDNVPELIVGRIIGDMQAQVVSGLGASLASGFDRSYGLATSGMEGEWEDFMGSARAAYRNWLDQQADGTCMADGGTASHWTAYVHKESLINGYHFPLESGSAVLGANLAGAGVELIKAVPAGMAWRAAHADLDLERSPFDHSLGCSFDAGDSLSAGDIDGDGNDEIVVGAIADDRIRIEYDPPNSGLAFTEVLSPWDVVLCADLTGDARCEIVVAHVSGTTEAFSYDTSGSAPTLRRLSTLGIPFSSHDGFGVGDVDTFTAGREIVVARDDDSRIHVYDSRGNTIADWPADPFVAGDGLVVADLDGDGADEIAILGHDDVDGKRRLQIFQNDCWAPSPGGWTLQPGEYAKICSQFLHCGEIRTTGGSGSDAFTAADIDADGIDELILAVEGEDRVYVLDGQYRDGWMARYRPVIEHVQDTLDLFVLRGHGNPGSLSPFNRLDVGGYHFGAGPLVFGLSCLTGNYEGQWSYLKDGTPTNDRYGDSSFAEAFLDSGTAVYIGATEVSSSGQNTETAVDFFSEWAVADTAGKALRNYKRSRSGDDWNRWRIEYNYYGDPKFGALGSPGRLEERSQGTAATPGSVVWDANGWVNLPAAQIESAAGTDQVLIAGARQLYEEGRPLVPYVVVERTYPAGTEVQDVTLLSQEATETFQDLDLPIASLAPDLADATLPAPVSTFAGWFPDRTHDWKVLANGDDTCTLQVRLYPFLYDNVARQARYFRRICLKAETLDTGLTLADPTLDKPTYRIGDSVIAGLMAKSTAKARDVVAELTIRRYGTNEILAGLPLQELFGLTGSASLSLTWNSKEATPGLCFVDAWLRSMDGQVLAHKTRLFDLGARNP